MHEIKKFFDNNRLNKGYNGRIYRGQNDIEIIRKQYNHILPKIDIIAEYEELYPGTLEKLFSLAQKEQQHRHALDLLALEKYDQAVHIGRIFGFLLVFIMALFSFYMMQEGTILTAIIFAFLPISLLISIVFFSLKNFPASLGKKP